MRTQKMSSIQTHLLVTYLVAILCPMIAIIIFFTYTISQDISKQRLDFMVQMNAQVNNNVDSLFSGMENIFSMHYLNYSVLDILRERGPLTDLEYIQNNSLMRDVIMQSVGMTQYIENIFVIGRNDVIYTASSATKRQEAFIKSWIDEHFFEDDSGYITDTFSGFDSLNVNQEFDFSGTEKSKLTFFGVVRQIYDINNQPLGYICIVVNTERFMDALVPEEKDLSDQRLSNTVIINNQKIIYPYNRKIHTDAQIWLQSGKLTDTESTEKITYASNRKFGYISCTNHTSGWQIVQYMQADQLKKNIFDALKYLYLAIFLFTGLVLFLGYLTIRSTIRPIHHLISSINQIDENNLVPLDTAHKTNNEVGVLIQAYNKMILRLSESLTRELKYQRAQHQMELEMLQTQINPHFLYNTLGLMGAIGDLNNISEIRIISESLADMFRYNIKGSHVVFLEDELKQVKNYITIQTFRFADSFKIKYQILPDLLHCRIVKFLIQPVIENAIYHGLEPRGEGGVLILQVSEKENNLLIYVKDNGVGIPKKRLKELHDKLEHTQENVLFGIENRSIGILNCHYRIQHYYGKQYGLSINSTEGKGTEVMMIIPKIEG